LDALSLDVQALLLQILETRQVVRVGESSKRDASFRVIAAARPGLADKVAEGAFRRDLYDQLNALTICLPPLRERREDIGLLARAFAAENQVVRLPPQVIEHLEQYSWPGNVGELRSIIAGYAAIGEMPQAPIESDERLAELLSRVLDVSRPYQVQKDQIFNLFVDVYLTMLLEYTHGNQSEAARVSGLDRAHLNKMVARLRRESKGFPSAR
jgi:transcriptional regulator with PAS, ATPase and Fis domain